MHALMVIIQYSLKNLQKCHFYHLLFGGLVKNTKLNHFIKSYCFSRIQFYSKLLVSKYVRLDCKLFLHGLATLLEGAGCLFSSVISKFQKLFILWCLKAVKLDKCAIYRFVSVSTIDGSGQKSLIYQGIITFE